MISIFPNDRIPLRRNQWPWLNTHSTAKKVTACVTTTCSTYATPERRRFGKFNWIETIFYLWIIAFEWLGYFIASTPFRYVHHRGVQFLKKISTALSVVGSIPHYPEPFSKWYQDHDWCRRKEITYTCSQNYISKSLEVYTCSIFLLVRGIPYILNYNEPFYILMHI